MRVLTDFYEFVIQPPSSLRQLHGSVPVQAYFIINVRLFNRTLPWTTAMLSHSQMSLMDPCITYDFHFVTVYFFRAHFQ